MHLKSIAAGLMLAIPCAAPPALAAAYPLGHFSASSGTVGFGDDFSDGAAPPNGPWGPSSYWNLKGNYPAGVEDTTVFGGSLVLNPLANGTPVPGFPGRVSVAGFAPMWATNGTAFSLFGAFQLKSPSIGESYGILLHDFSFGAAGPVFNNWSYQLRVDAIGGKTVVRMATADYGLGTVTELGSQEISTSGHSGLGLFLRYSGSGLIQATYQYFDGYTLYGSPTLVSENAFGGDAHLMGYFASAPAVPEPEIYALFLAGLGVIGAISRKRAKR